MASKLKPFPAFASDAEAERFVETADLSQYDLMAGALPRDVWFARAEELYKDARITLRLPQAVVDAYKPRPRPAACLICGFRRKRHVVTR
jgi:predicted DNA binding CopG/RHH family protein